jgi:phosphatidylethanolamine/phosphatidyl-N-methylethanolamine N-methyltransferase
MGDAKTKTHDERIFFGKWLRDPLRMGTFLPSGPALARAVAAAANTGREGAVVELGGGTGAVTKALLAAGVAPEDLVVIEREKGLYALLVSRFPNVRIVHGDALQMKELLAGIGPVKAVVSGIPLLNMPPSFQKRLLRASFDLLGEGGVFVQFTYGPGSPVPDRRLKSLGLQPRLSSRVWRNVPPASVWQITARGKMLTAETPRPAAAETGPAPAGL